MSSLFSFLMIVLLTNINFAVTLEFSTYLGGSGDDVPSGIALNSMNEIIITGYTESVNFPTTSGIFDSTYNLNTDIFLSKLSNKGESLLQSTYIGGSQYDYSISDLAIDSTDAIYIAGMTYSNDFPTTLNSFDDTFNGVLNGEKDIFFLKISSNLSTLIASSYFGGLGDEVCHDLEIDSMGDLFITGYVGGSANFPLTSGSFSTTFNGSLDSFVSKVSTNYSNLLFSTYVGGNSTDQFLRLKLNSSSNIVAYGWSFSNNFPTLNAYDNSQNGNKDVTLSKLSQNGSSLLFSTYFGGNKEEFSRALIIDSLNNIIIGGETNTFANFPLISPIDSIFTFREQFIAKFSSSGSNLLFSTYLGGDEWEYISSFDLDEQENLIIFSRTKSTNIPLVSALDTSLFSINSSWTPWITNLNLNSYNIEFSSYFGHNADNSDGYYKNGNYYFLTETYGNLPVTNGVFSPFHNGNEDIGVTSLQFVPSPSIEQVKIDISQQGIILSWDSESNASSYKIFRNTTPEFSNSTQIGTVTPNGNPPTFTDVGAISNGEKYFYFVTWEN